MMHSTLLILFTTIFSFSLCTVSPNCTCYIVDSGSTASYFHNRRFWDFRNLGPDHLASDAFTADWAVQSWSLNASDIAPLSRVNKVENVRISNGALTLLTTRLNSSTQSTAELETTQKNLHHGSFRFRARVIGPNNTAASPGACAGLFTFYDDSNESDVEILTKDPEDVYRYTNQPSLNKEGNTVPAASIEGTDLPPWSEWHTHRIDWLCKTSNWYLDDGLVASNTYSVPREPSGLIMNLWSDGGEWSWEMGIGEEVWLEVEWVEAVFDTSGPVDGPGKGKRGMEGCETVCKVDGVKEVGVPEVVEAPTSGGGREGLRRWGVVVVGALVVSLWSEGSGLRGVVSLQ